jgi:transposase-like protein
MQKEEDFKQKIFFEGQIYDAYSLVVDIIKKAKYKIVIIDNYTDDSILKMLVKKNKNVEVVILTSEKTNISKLDIQKFNKEYPILKVAKSNKFHDRFIIIDNSELYHLRSFNKRLGKEVFCSF